MNTVFLDHVNQKFWKLRASVSDPFAPKTIRLSECVSKILPRPVTKVPTSHFEPRISHLSFPFNLFMNVQPILKGGGASLHHQCYPCSILFRTSHFALTLRSRSFTFRSRYFTLFHAIFAGGEGALDPGLTQLSTPNSQPPTRVFSRTKTHGRHTENTCRTHEKNTRNTPQNHGNTRKHTRFFFPGPKIENRHRNVHPGSEHFLRATPRIAKHRQKTGNIMEAGLGSQT